MMHHACVHKYYDMELRDGVFQQPHESEMKNNTK